MLNVCELPHGCTGGAALGGWHIRRTRAVAFPSPLPWGNAPRVERCTSLGHLCSVNLLTVLHRGVTPGREGSLVCCRSTIVGSDGIVRLDVSFWQVSFNTFFAGGGCVGPAVLSAFSQH